MCRECIINKGSALVANARTQNPVSIVSTSEGKMITAEGDVNRCPNLVSLTHIGLGYKRDERGT